jgi:hypothetical protein
MEDVLAQLGKFTTFSTLDLQSSFWQIRMALEEVKKTTVITKNVLFEWLVMPFGLKSAIGTFSRVMKEIFRDELDSFVKIFIDDLNIHSLDWKEHLQDLLSTQGVKSIKRHEPEA